MAAAFAVPAAVAAAAVAVDDGLDANEAAAGAVWWAAVLLTQLHGEDGSRSNTQLRRLPRTTHSRSPLLQAIKSSYPTANAAHRYFVSSIFLNKSGQKSRLHSCAPD
jgi:hypothetical protein